MGVASTCPSVHLPIKKGISKSLNPTHNITPIQSNPMTPKPRRNKRISYRASAYQTSPPSQLPSIFVTNPALVTAPHSALGHLLRNAPALMFLPVSRVPHERGRDDADDHYIAYRLAEKASAKQIPRYISREKEMFEAREGPKRFVLALESMLL